MERHPSSSPMVARRHRTDGMRAVPRPRDRNAPVVGSQPARHHHRM